MTAHYIEASTPALLAVNITKFLEDKIVEVIDISYIGPQSVMLIVEIHEEPSEDTYFYSGDKVFSLYGNDPDGQESLQPGVIKTTNGRYMREGKFIKKSDATL